VTVAKVKLGPSDGQHIAILSGVQPGERVVVDGADRLRDGAKVSLAPSKPEGTAPGDEPNKGQPQAAAGQTEPRPADSEGVAGQRPSQQQGQRPGEGQGGERRRGTQ
jgi:multidrug efflux system membrane fusion protein